MVEVLRSQGGNWMTRDEIAREIARRDLFRRPSDGRHPPSDQLRLRARQYQHLFECSDTRCSRIRLRLGGQPLAAQPAEVPRAPDPHRVSTNPSTRARTGDPPSRDETWYEELRERYRPDRLRVLLIAESPPDPGAGNRRFFYSPELRADNLYRGVAEALYGERPNFDVRKKTAVLDQLKADGFWLIDAVDTPVDKLGSTARTAAIQAATASVVDACIRLAPELGVIICHGKVYAAAAAPLRDAGVNVLHDESLPFPLGNWRAQFVAGFRRALFAARNAAS
jgi:hypothetical protein